MGMNEAEFVAAKFNSLLLKSIRWRQIQFVAVAAKFNSPGLLSLIRC